MRPLRAGSPGRNTAEQWASRGRSEDEEGGTGGVVCAMMAESSNLTSTVGVAEATPRSASTGYASCVSGVTMKAEDERRS
ncbi:hypothetical protein GCM10009535_56200 [Streptomyces thermocarboxydovorans]|uniref:Uncharacterized protein n=1 Tax=Streptomyces thermocarboxydovorans TaxID=59298 RepID=A0ABN1HVZ4_9ACTN